METKVRKWITIALINLLIVATLGVLLRYKIAYSLPFIDQKHVLHSHSHFAFDGWVTQVLLALLIHYLCLQTGKDQFKRYRAVLYLNLVAAYGMMVSFLIQGYGFYSISFSTLSILVSYYFAFRFWKDLNDLPGKRVSHLWFKASLVFNILSSLGAFALAFMMANKIVHQNWYLAAVYYFLHFQYNGWFFFAGAGLLASRFQYIPGVALPVRRIFWLFCLTCIPAYLLSALWLPFPDPVYWLVIAAVIAQVAGWWLFIKFLRKQKDVMHGMISRLGRTLLILSAIAFTIKIILQSGSIHPGLSDLSYSFRPIVIGYLHLVLLAVTSIFILGYITGFNLVGKSGMLTTGIFIFVAGIILNELLLMVQGVSAISYTGVPYINEALLAVACMLFTGAATIVVSRFSTREQPGNGEP